MIKNKVEQIVRRRLVKQFISEDSASIVLRRRIRVATAAGGWVWGPRPLHLPPQTIRIVPAKRRYGNANVNTEAGDIEVWPYQLVGYYDMDIQKGDEFTWQGDNYKVETVEQDRDERTVAYVVYNKAG